jgi:excinuclease UvrABC nuclease subunit
VIYIQDEMDIKKIILENPCKENNYRVIDKDIPQDSGVYLLFDSNLELIYIGKSDNIRRRILQHTSNKSKRYKDDDDYGYLTKIPLGEAIYYSYVKVDDSSQRECYEKILISIFKPRYNL